MKSTIYLDDEMARALRRLARARGRSQADMIREAVAEYMAQAEPPQPKGIGAYRSGRSDVSGRAEEVLREAARKRR